MKRLIPGILLAALWLLLLLYGSFPLFWLAVITIVVIGAHEYLKMALPASTTDIDFLFFSFLVALPAIFVGMWHEDGVGGGLFLAVFLSICYVLFNYSKLANSLQFLNRLIFGAVYIGFFAAHLVLLHLQPEGNLWLIILVGITAGSDSGAYYSGKKFGKHKLSRHVSPNKTVEGAAGGVICAFLVAVLLAFLLLDQVNWVVLMAASIALVCVGIVGDLCESMVKRGTDTKDSGRILLGHGGLLDRIDSLLLAAPFLYYLRIFTG
ncbi:MAG: phosphatidate cytidylyltransferase [Desulfocapsaceae bacterium]|nr:phosphatidate cytidylyltransferase [Desulfocapsaceae bacterium]